MSKTYTIKISDLEEKILSWGEANPKEWLERIVKNRALKAIDDIYQEELRGALKDPSVSEISSNKKEVVLRSKIESAKIRNEKAMKASVNQFPEINGPKM